MYTKKDTREAEKIFKQMSKEQLISIALDYREGYFRMLDLFDSRPTPLAPDRAKSARKLKPSASKRSKSGAAGKA